MVPECPKKNPSHRPFRNLPFVVMPAKADIQVTSAVCSSSRRKPGIRHL